MVSENQLYIQVVYVLISGILFSVRLIKSSIQLNGLLIDTYYVVTNFRLCTSVTGSVIFYIRRWWDFIVFLRHTASRR